MFTCIIHKKRWLGKQCLDCLTNTANSNKHEQTKKNLTGWSIGKDDNNTIKQT